MANPEQAQQQEAQQKQEQMQNKVQGLQEKLGPAFQKMQEAQMKGQALNEKMQEAQKAGDQGLVERLQKEIQKANAEVMQAMLAAFKILEQIRRAYAEIGQEEQFFNSQLGEHYNNFKEQLNSQEG